MESDPIFSALCASIEAKRLQYPSLGVVETATVDIATRLMPRATLSGDQLQLAGYFDVADALAEMRLRPTAAHLFHDGSVEQPAVAAQRPDGILSQDEINKLSPRDMLDYANRQKFLEVESSKKRTLKHSLSSEQLSRMSPMDKLTYANAQKAAEVAAAKNGASK